VSTLTSCIKKAGEYISADDRAAILRASQQFRSEGMETAEAAKAAVEQRIAAVREMLTPKPVAAAAARVADGEGALNQSGAGPGFYSALSRAVEGAAMKAAPASGWKDAIKGWVAKGQVKADEVEWSGVNEWLDLQQGKVAREAVAEYLDANGVKVTETVLGDEVGALPDGWEVRPSQGDFESDFAYVLTDETGEIRGAGDTQREAIEDGWAPDEVKPGAKYTQYQLPGGTNYREVLLTLPGPKPAVLTELPAGYSITMNRLQGPETPFTVTPDAQMHGQPFAGFHATEQEAIDAAVARLNREAERSTDGQFKSTHWDQPNVLAHIRVNDRTDADGKRVLFVEEIQSDWGQAGKKARDDKVKALAKERGITEEEADKMVPRDAGFANDEQAKVRAEYARLRDQPGGFPETDPAALAVRARLRELDAASKVPAAPFVGKTDAWVSLALKRIVKMAVDGGYDKVAFVTGEQSADRYDLSKQISKVRYEDNSTGGVGRARMDGAPGSGQLYAYDIDGNLKIERRLQDPINELPDLIGKDLAEKLLNAAPNERRSSGGFGVRQRELSGLDLKVGGEGMKAFYDRIVPAVAKDVLRKLGGGAMETVDMDVRKLPSVPLVDGMPAEAPGFAITDAMKAKASTGVPLFQGDKAPRAQIQFGVFRVYDSTGNPLGYVQANDPRQALALAKTKTNADGTPKFPTAARVDTNQTFGLISLLEGADKSSFIHESGHAFLEIQAELARRVQARIDAGEKVTPGQQGILDDMNRILTWFGITGYEQASGPTGGALEQAVYHGSPHTFNEFSLSAIGTGEGAQAYGWGLYFAENRDIAKGYFERLGGRQEIQDLKVGTLRVGPYNGFDYSRRASVNTLENVRASFVEDLLIDEAALIEAQNSGKLQAFVLQQFDEKVANYADEWPEAVGPATRLRHELARPGAVTLKLGQKEGGIYSIEIPDDAVAKMLLWDEPLSQQPEFVRKALQARMGENALAEEERLVGARADKLAAEFAAAGEKHDRGAMLALAKLELVREKTAERDAVDFADPAQQRLWNSLDLELNQLKAVGALRNEPTGERIYQDIEADLGSDQAASEYLNSLGIPGLRYWDGGSRDRAQGMRNVVVWDQKTLDAMNAQVQRTLSQGGKETQPPTVQPRGRTPLETWSMMSLSEREHYHEMFARGFEQYTMEGVAPSLELQGAFNNFRKWLVAIYKKLANLNVNLTDDVRAVMGRMLASDAAIEEAEAARSLHPMIRTAEDAAKLGWSKEKFDAYQLLAQGPTDEAIKQLQTRGMKDMQWLSGARDRAIREKQRENDALRDEIRDEVTAEVNDMPVFRAKAQLDALQVQPDQAVAEANWKEQRDAALAGFREQQKADLYAANPDVKGIQKGQLLTKNKKAMENRAQAQIIEWEAANPKPARVQNATDLDLEVVAESNGFGSVAEMLQAIDATGSKADTITMLTDVRMLERYGDINSAEALAKAADEAVFNRLRAKFLTREWKALQDATTKKEKVGKQHVDVMAQAARKYAADLVGKLKIREIKPNVFAASMVRNGKAAERAFMAGKTAEAAMHKRNQAVNAYATQAAYSGLAEVEKHRTYLKKFDKRLKSIDPKYQDQIEGLLVKFDFRKSSIDEAQKARAEAKTAAQIKAAEERLAELDALGPTQEREGLAQWLEKLGEYDVKPDLSDVSQGTAKSYRDMTIDEMRDLVDDIKRIEHLGRLKNRLLMARDKREFDAVKADVIEAISASKKGERRPYRLETGDKTMLDRFNGFLTEHRKLSSLIREIDQGNDDGPLYNAVGRSMNAQDAWEQDRNEKVTKRLLALLDPLLKMPGGLSGNKSKVFIPAIGTSMTRQGRISVVLNYGNEDGRQRLMSGKLKEGKENWTDAQIKAVMETLSPQELEIVNKVWTLLDEFWPEIAAKEERVNGVAPEKVEAAPFTVKANDGTLVQMRGGYYPLKYDRSESASIATKDAKALAEEAMRGATTRSTTRRGHTKERVDGVKHKLRLDLNVIPEHVQEVVHDLAWHEWLIDANKLFRDDEVAQALSDYYGAEVRTNIQAALQAIAGGDRAARDHTTDLALMLRSNVSRAVMGWSLTTAFLQPFGLLQSMARNGVGNVLSGMGRFLGTPKHMSDTLRMIGEKSPMMRHRAITMNRELYEISKIVRGKSKAMRVFDASLFMLTTKLQAVADVPTWLGAYNKALQEKPQDEQRAIDLADRAVIEAQGSGSTKDLAKVQRDHPFLTQFMSYFSAGYQIAVEKTKFADFRNPAAVAGWAADMALLAILPAIIPNLIMHLLKGGGDDEPEELAKKMLQWQAQFLLAPIVGAREFAGVVGGFDYAGPPAARIVVDTTRLYKQAAQGDVLERLGEGDDKLLLPMFLVAGDLTGIPTAQLARSYKGWKAWEEGEQGAGPQSVLFGPPPKP